MRGDIYGPQEFVNQGSIHCTVPGAVDGLSLPFHWFNFGRLSDVAIMNCTIELILLVYFSWFTKMVKIGPLQNFKLARCFIPLPSFSFLCCSFPTSLVFFCLLFNFHCFCCLGELRRREPYFSGVTSINIDGHQGRLCETEYNILISLSRLH